MSLSTLLVLLFVAQCRALTFSRKGRYIPNIKVADEIEVADVTFTTRAPAESDQIAGHSGEKYWAGEDNHNRPRRPMNGYHAEPAQDYERRYPEQHRNSNWRNRQKYWPKGHSGAMYHPGPRVQQMHGPSRYRGTGYTHKYKRPAKKPVYYLVGDEMKVMEDNDEKPPQKLYDSRDLNFVKPSKKPSYPKKYSPQVLKKPYPKGKHYSEPLSTSYGDNEDVTDDSDDDESEHNHREIPRNHQPLKEEHPEESKRSKGDRVEFQMYGMDGPNSYKFGFDTGKGENRHFRFEERDSEGRVKGHYGYMDHDGKMRIMKYEADPEKGFKAGPVDYPQDESE